MKKIAPAILLLLTVATSFAQRTWDTIPFNPDHYRERYELFKKEAIVQEKIIFLGNSITEGGNWKKLLKDSSVINRGISGDITFGVLNRFEEVLNRKPAKLFLMIGVNDLAKNIPEEVVIQNIFSLASQVKRRSPKTKLYIQSILPTNPAIQHPDYLNAHFNKDDHIQVVNGQLRKFAARLNYTFVDLYSSFLDKESHLDAKYTDDGLHLNWAGYMHWVETLKELKLL